MCHQHSEAKMLGLDLIEQSWSCWDMHRHVAYITDLAEARGLCSFFDVAAGMFSTCLTGT